MPLGNSNCTVQLRCGLGLVPYSLTPRLRIGTDAFAHELQPLVCTLLGAFDNDNNVGDLIAHLRQQAFFLY